MIHHRSVLADLLTPVSAFLRVAGSSERAFLLESVEGGEKIGRFSFIGVDPESSYRGTFAEFRRTFPEILPPHPDGGKYNVLNFIFRLEICRDV